MFVAAIRLLDVWLRFALWLRGHAVTLLRYTCHGLVGPPG
jgi:hypothetical protein